MRHYNIFMGEYDFFQQISTEEGLQVETIKNPTTVRIVGFRFYIGIVI